MSLENGRITPEQISVPDKLLPELKSESGVQNMDVGAHAVINCSAIWYDEEGKCWLDGNYPLGLEVSDEFPSPFRVGVIRFFDGFVVEIVTPAKRPNRIEKWTDEELEAAYSKIHKIPIVAFITTAEEFEVLKEVYQADFNKPLLDVIKSPEAANDNSHPKAQRGNIKGNRPSPKKRPKRA